jgi:hypothetical protein
MTKYFQAIMKVVIDRKRRGPEEGVALTVYAQEPSERAARWQFKIDVWSEKNSGQFQMRLEGFNFLRLWKDDLLPRLLMSLAALDASEVLETFKQMQEVIREAVTQARKEGQILPDMLETPELVVVECFEAQKAQY